MTESVSHTPELQQVDPEVLTSIEAMTEGILNRAKVELGRDGTEPVVEFLVTRPTRPYSLRLYMIPEGRFGFNTSQFGQDVQDNSARWSIHINRGTIRGIAFDGKGVVYRHGGYEPDRYVHHQNVETGSILDLIRDFYRDNPHGNVQYRLLNHLEDATIPVGEYSQPRSLHEFKRGERAQQPYFRQGFKGLLRKLFR